jgi:hypothetical protein
MGRGEAPAGQPLCRGLPCPVVAVLCFLNLRQPEILNKQDPDASCRQGLAAGMVLLCPDIATRLDANAGWYSLFQS